MIARMTAWRVEAPRSSDGLRAATLGLLIRAGVVTWAALRFPPAEDGKYYHIIAGRIARGLGYTWLWPDGAVTYAAHYPVGYPALVGAVYALFGARPVWAMVLNAVLGAALVAAVHRVAATEASRAGALLAALLVALHPGLIFYTPALMTEGAAAALLAVAAAVAVHRFAQDARGAACRVGTLGAVFGALTLVRPQSLLLAPLYALVATPRMLRARAFAAMGTLAVALAVCAPWTIRNCTRMQSCVLVSANAGFNLFIGAAEGATGAWVSIDRLGVPAACRTVWGEAQKDACFRSAALDEIRRSPGRFLALVPKKLATTFDYAGAAGWYLHASNGTAFDDTDKIVLGAVETVWERLVLLLGLAALAGSGPRRKTRLVVLIASGAALLVRSAWVTHIGICIAALLHGRRLLERPAAALAVATVLGTALTHAIFFGAGRYSLVCFPALAALAGTVLTRQYEPRDTGSFKE